MASFFYFIPSTKSVLTEEMAAMHGIQYAADPEHSFSATRMESAPNGSGGPGLVAYTGNGSFAGIERAKWSQLPGSKAFVGIDPQNPPGPADLARPNQFNGHFVMLEDGNRWLVPVARAVNGVSPLPKRLEFIDGTWTSGDLLPRYTRLYSAACRLWDALLESKTDEVTIEEECNVSAEALAVNYRLGPVEISMLGLFSTDSQTRVCKAVLDWPYLEEVKKKLDAGELSLKPGAGD